MSWKNVIPGALAAGFFSLLYLLGVFGGAEELVYDSFLRFRPEREESGEVVFIDVDDSSIEYNGVFPWPRSVIADSLLKLKEFGARTAIFDIEYVDKGPQGVDTIYLDQGLPADFDRSFSEINSAAGDIFSALKSGRSGNTDIDELAGAFADIISGERERLFSRAQGVARDNDLYLVQASALFGRSWATLNLRDSSIEEGERAERRLIAEERFSYPVKALADAPRGGFVDILPPLPDFALAAKGAGFTNVEIDPDGIRRRIYLTQNIHDHWYLQLAFAPLIDYLGRPDIELDPWNLIIRNAEMPGGITKDITIPLDGNGRMMLDWPKEEYADTYDHFSFVSFSLMDEIEAELEKYSRALNSTDIPFFAQYDASLAEIPFIIGDLEDLFDAVAAAKNNALENCSEDSFSDFVNYRAMSRELVGELLRLDPAGKVRALAPELADAFPEYSAYIAEEADYIASLADALGIDLERYDEIAALVGNTIKDKFCVIGRVDTGTTDIGANPFWGEYINVGTHGVVLDMILMESFITPVDIKWRIIFSLFLVSLFFLVSAKLSPVPRVVSGFAVTAFIIGAAALLFRYTGIFFDPMIAALSLVSAAIVREIISYAGSEREKQFIRKAFSTYLSDDVVKEIIADPSRLQLGGVNRYMSAIFTDIQGFSSIAEKLNPEALVSVLNRYLSAMSDVVLEEKGTIDKYEGDAIIAFFGAPVDIPDHAYRACVSAITMKRIEMELNKAIMAERISPAPLLTRIGINTGNMVAGNMGTENKMNYTIMGNAVNLTARLEGVNKQYGTWILASDDTVREAGGKILTRKLDMVRVIGIEEPVRIHELLNIVADSGDDEKKMAKVFDESVDLYEAGKWREAAQGFREVFELEEKGPSALYLRRCESFLKTPPPDNWNPVNNLAEK